MHTFGVRYEREEQGVGSFGAVEGSRAVVGLCVNHLRRGDERWVLSRKNLLPDIHAQMRARLMVGREGKSCT